MLDFKDARPVSDLQDSRPVLDLQDAPRLVESAHHHFQNQRIQLLNHRHQNQRTQLPTSAIRIKGLSCTTAASARLYKVCCTTATATPWIYECICTPPPPVPEFIKSSAPPPPLPGFITTTPPPPPPLPGFITTTPHPTYAGMLQPGKVKELGTLFKENTNKNPKRHHQTKADVVPSIRPKTNSNKCIGTSWKTLKTFWNNLEDSVLSNKLIEQGVLGEVEQVFAAKTATIKKKTAVESQQQPTKIFPFTRLVAAVWYQSPHVCQPQ